jgi:hypothetical protein
MGGLLTWILANYVESMKTNETFKSKWVIPFAWGVMVCILTKNYKTKWRNGEITMNKPTLNLQDIVADCEFEFWDRVATKHMPLVRSGDFDPMQAYALEQALENAIRHWWRWNGEEHYNLKDGVDILEGEE